MKVAARTDYAVRAVIELAAHSDLVSATRLAEAQSIPRQFLDLILGDLRRAGLITSQRGVSGGFRLARHPDAISLGDVIRAVDGPLAQIRGEDPDDLSYEGAAVGLRDVWRAVRSDLEQLLDQTSVGQVAGGRLPDRVRRAIPYG